MMRKQLAQEIRKYYKHRNDVKDLLRSTQQLLSNINSQNVFPQDNKEEKVVPSLTLEKIQHLFDKNPAVVVFGQNSKAKAQVVNSLLTTNILPIINGDWRWIKFEYGVLNCVNLSHGLKYEDILNIKEIQHSWTIIPVEELSIPKNDDPNCPTVINAQINHPILRDISIFVAPDSGAIESIEKNALKILPLFLYALDDHPLTDDNIRELWKLKRTFPYSTILFVSSLENHIDVIDDKKLLTKNYGKNTGAFDFGRVDLNAVEIIWMEQVQSLGFMYPSSDVDSNDGDYQYYEQYLNLSRIYNVHEKSDVILNGLINNLKAYVVDSIEYLKEIQANVIQKFNTGKDDLQREIAAMPERMKYSVKMSKNLLQSLLNIVSDDDGDLTLFMQNVLQDMKINAMDNSDSWFQYSCMLFEEDHEYEWYKTMRAASADIQNQIFNELSNKISAYISTSVDNVRELFFEPLTCCLTKMKQMNEYFNYSAVINSLNRVFTAAKEIDLQHASLMNSMINALTDFFVLILPPAMSKLRGSWQKSLRIDILQSLSADDLVNNMQKQYRKNVKKAYKKFEACLQLMIKSMEQSYHHMENQRQTMSKLYTPKIARLALQTMSLGNIIQYGLPKGLDDDVHKKLSVIDNSLQWGDSLSTCVVKSMTFTKEKYWRLLGMEFYRKSTLDHEKIVKLRGFILEISTFKSLTSYAYRLLYITERLPTNLHTAIRYHNFPLQKRIEVAIDVIEGLKYLHSLGLLHGNLKLNRVLLDENDRAKLDIELDMIDGGDWDNELLNSSSEMPVHLAPELRSKKYNAMVDVYSFGILLWYICAGYINAPKTYHQFESMDEMWKGVMKGIRPERLPYFNDDCWNLMQRCWETDPANRPQLNNILTTLEAVRDKIKLGHLQKELDITHEFGKYKELCLLKHKQQNVSNVYELSSKAFLNKMGYYGECI